MLNQETVEKIIQSWKKMTTINIQNVNISQVSILNFIKNFASEFFEKFCVPSVY